MYVYKRTHYSYSPYGLALSKIDRLQEQMQRQVKRAEEKLQRQKADEAQKTDIQNKPVKPESAESVKSSLLGDFMFNPGGAAPGGYVEILANGVRKGGTGTYLDILGSGDTGGVGMMDVLAGTQGGSIINIVTGISTGPSVVQATATSSPTQDPISRKVSIILATNALKQAGSNIDVKA